MTDQRINVQTSFNANFCQSLEFHLCAAFATSNDQTFKYWWCDGVDVPMISNQFTSRNITSIKQITSKAWIGLSGSNRYEIVIKLDRYSRRGALKGLDLGACLPITEFKNWVDIDLINHTITILLN